MKILTSTVTCLSLFMSAFASEDLASRNALNEQKIVVSVPACYIEQLQALESTIVSIRNQVEEECSLKNLSASKVQIIDIQRADCRGFTLTASYYCL